MNATINHSRRLLGISRGFAALTSCAAFRWRGRADPVDFANNFLGRQFVALRSHIPHLLVLVIQRRSSPKCRAVIASHRSNGVSIFTCLQCGTERKVVVANYIVLPKLQYLYSR